MITEVLLNKYLVLLFIWWWFWRIIKIIADVGDILNNDEFFGDVVDTPKVGIEQHKKREELKSVLDKGKAHWLRNKWTHKRVDKASNKAINKTYAEYKQPELNEKGERTAKALGKHAINLHFTGISWWLKIGDVKSLGLDIDNDLIIKDQMASLGFLLVCTFGNLLAPVVVAAYTVKNLGFGDEPQDEDYESN